MSVHPLAGQHPPETMLISPDSLRAQYYDLHPDPSDPEQRVAFGTSGHRGSAQKATFNEDHLLAVTQAVVEYRAAQGITGPLFLGRDSHALSAPAQRTVLEVLASQGVTVLFAPDGGFTPTPAVSHAILKANRDKTSGLADGLILTPSHNPPADGGIKYNPPSGGPADTTITAKIEKRANELLANGNRDVRRIPYEAALRESTTRFYDFVTGYVDDLGSVIQMEEIRASGLTIGADPLGGASVGYWGPIAEKYGLNLTVVNETVDPTFRFMPLDHDGVIRMDCSSPYAMSDLVSLKDRYGIAFGCDTDADRHGIVTPSGGLMNPNHFLSAAIFYLFQNRSGWNRDAAIGKTLVSSSMIDRVGKRIGRRVVEVPVGFKWFVEGLLDGSFGFGGEESAGASFLCQEGEAWSTDKDGLLLGLLASEITAKTGKDPSVHYQELTAELGNPIYARTDAPANTQQKAALKKLSPEAVKASTLAGETIKAKLTQAPGNGADIGGLKVVTENGWFAARPSGTEDIYKIYAESFRDRAHLDALLQEAQEIVTAALG